MTLSVFLARGKSAFVVESKAMKMPQMPMTTTQKLQMMILLTTVVDVADVVVDVVVVVVDAVVVDAEGVVVVDAVRGNL